ncbi:MAG: VOC family protein [Chloroflexi bacterium]|nr:VOC family protein [Chloroflexota bacterium]
MQVVTSYPDGVFCWVDLASSDPEAAKTFYTSLFGWEFEDTHTDIGTIYTMFKLNGYNVAAVSRMSPEMQAQGVPPFWSSYVSHSNVDAAAAKATEAGGTLMFPPFDVMEEGRMTMLQDPSGAMIGIWQAKNHTGAQLVNQSNTLVWNELQTRDSDAAKSFFNTVFGWEGKTDKTGYVTYFQNDRRHAGMIQMDETWGEIPANWGVYFMVDDINVAAAKVEALGGTLMMPPTPAGDIGHFFVAQDPQGGTFSLIQFNGPVDPPPGH